MHPKESNFGTFKQLWPRSGKLCCTKLYNHNDQPLLSYKNLGCLTSANFSGLCCWYTWKSANIAGQIHRLSDALRFWLLVSGIRTNLLGTQRGGQWTAVDSHTLLGQGPNVNKQNFQWSSSSMCKQDKNMQIVCYADCLLANKGLKDLKFKQCLGLTGWTDCSGWSCALGLVFRMSGDVKCREDAMISLVGGLRSHKSYAVHNLSHKNAKMLTAPVVAWVELTEKYQEALQVHSKYPKSPSYLTSWRACSDEQEEDRSMIEVLMQMKSWNKMAQVQIPELWKLGALHFRQFFKRSWLQDIQGRQLTEDT